MKLSLVALGVAAAEADHKVRETEGNNRGARIRQYLAGAGISVDAPWCAAFVDYCYDLAARTLGASNPLEPVKLEALVQSYYDRLQGDQIEPYEVEPGDLVLFKFPGPDRWNHMGLVSQPPKQGSTVFFSVEGNTGDVDQREGDGVYVKPRDIAKQPTCFISPGRDRE